MRNVPHMHTLLAAARIGIIVDTAMTDDKRHAASPPRRPPSVPPLVIAATARRPVCGSKVSLMNDQKAEIIAAPKIAV